MKRITDLTAVDSLESTDSLLIETGTGTRRMEYSNFLPYVSHNSIIRNNGNGNNLGTITIDNIDTFLTDHGVTTGTFNGLYVGDYFTATYDGTSKTFRIAGFDSYLYTGDTSLVRHHIVIVPDAVLMSAAMNSTNTTGVSANEENESEKQAYLGSDMWNLVIPTINEKLEAIFGNHLLEYRDLLSNTIDANAISRAYGSYKGAVSNREWVFVKANLMSEAQVIGQNVMASSFLDTGVCQKQLPLFRIEPKYINPNRQWFWLREVVSSTIFAFCYNHGVVISNNASSVGGVRPFFLLG